MKHSDEGFIRELLKIFSNRNAGKREKDEPLIKRNRNKKAENAGKWGFFVKKRTFFKKNETFLKKALTFEVQGGIIV